MARVAWQIGLFRSALRQAADRRRNWHIVHHEELCRDPRQGFQQLFDDLGLTWTTAAEEFLDRSNRPGTGIATNRITSDQPDRWRRRLTYDQVHEARRALALFPATTAT